MKLDSSDERIHLQNAWRRIGAQLYLLNASLLITLEIDSAYWREWELFHLPGGITVFLIVNFLLIWLVFFGFSRVIIGAPSARWFSYGLATTGIFAFTIHNIFLTIGYEQFGTVISMGLLFVILVVSLSQILAVAMSGSELPVSHRT